MLEKAVSETFNSLCEILFLMSLLDIVMAGAFNSLCEIPTLFFASFTGLITDLSLSPSGAVATPRLAPEYIKGSGVSPR